MRHRGETGERFSRSERLEQSASVGPRALWSDEQFPQQEMYGLTSQTRRAGASIAANIVEGCGRSGNGDFARFLYMAMGSASEVEYHLLLARDLGFLPLNDYQEATARVVEVKRMLSALIGKVNSERATPKPKDR